jgi:hypothetical protein
MLRPAAEALNKRVELRFVNVKRNPKVAWVFGFGASVPE